jgi:hypothetical protein
MNNDIIVGQSAGYHSFTTNSILIPQKKVFSMKKPIVAGLVIIILMLAASLHAQIYKYIDEEGRKRWTDDLSQVPKAQRASAEQFEGVRDVPQEPSTKQEQSQTAITQNTDQGGDKNELTRESLMKEKSDLDNQYQSLLEERKQLEKMKSEKDDTTNRAELNKRISAYNAKTEQYETQLSAYKEKIAAYKEKISTTGATPKQ